MEDQSDTAGHDVTVIGGGIVGAAIAYGLAARGQRVAVLDEGDRAQRAARANFGLTWVQTKGDGMPAYMRWTRRSADLWPDFAARLKAEAGDTEYRKPGGVMYCIGEAGFEERRRKVEGLRAQADVFGTEMIDRIRLEALMPAARFGPDVTGASYCPHDGHCSPLKLLRALHAAMQAAGVRYLAESPAQAVKHRGGRFLVTTPRGIVESGKLVLAAGHGTPSLAAQVGIDVNLVAERGQILVTERLRPFLPLPGSGIRQTEDGTVMIGSSKEDTGFDDRTTVAVGSRMASQALRVLPELARVKINRTWGGIRVLTPDNCPVYLESASCPGAFVALCHSGVTLAAVHAGDFAEAVAAGRLPESMNDFHPRRFDVPVTPSSWL
jgi:glycine/D-amino acid oxidase-like deaminating enzyme